MDPAAVKTRFAPSPTGLMHLGNLRTALFNALWARKQGGVFLLRLEDTDRERSRVAYAEAIAEDLRWLGLDWQEGPDVGGAHGPYSQSMRDEIYQHYFDSLADQGRVYPCFCSERELALIRKSQLAAGQPPRYPGTCAHLGEAEVHKRLDQGLQPVLRFRVPAGREVGFDDAVKGAQRFRTDEIGDFIIRRADGSAAFFFTNAVDDALMGVTHVLRGEDHLTNTPRQLLLLEALGLVAPAYGHIAMIVGDDGAPLSKRNGSRPVSELRAEGLLPSALTNHLARLGHYYADNHLMDLDALAARFELDHLGSAPARFDAVQLEHWQAEALAALDTPALRAWAGEDSLASVPEPVRESFLAAVRANVARPADIAAWAERVFAGATPEADAAEAMAGAQPQVFSEALSAYREAGSDYRTFIDTVKARTGVKGKALFMPIRAALTGATHGPELSALLPLMPAAAVQQRLRDAEARAAGADPTEKSTHDA